MTVPRVSIEPFAAGRVAGKCVAQCLVTFYDAGPRVTTTVVVIEVPRDTIDNDEALWKHMEELEKMYLWQH